MLETTKHIRVLNLFPKARVPKGVDVQEIADVVTETIDGRGETRVLKHHSVPIIGRTEKGDLYFTYRGKVYFIDRFDIKEYTTIK